MSLSSALAKVVDRLERRAQLKDWATQELLWHRRMLREEFGSLMDTAQAMGVPFLLEPHDAEDPVSSVRWTRDMEPVLTVKNGKQEQFILRHDAIHAERIA